MAFSLIFKLSHYYDEQLGPSFADLGLDVAYHRDLFLEMNERFEETAGDLTFKHTFDVNSPLEMTDRWIWVRYATMIDIKDDAFDLDDLIPELVKEWNGQMFTGDKVSQVDFGIPITYSGVKFDEVTKMPKISLLSLVKLG
jgi:hypothetical protein